MNIELIIILFLTIFMFLIIICQFFLVMKIYRQITQLKTMNIESKDWKLNENLKEEVHTTVLLKMFSVRNAVQKQSLNIHVKVIERAPKVIGMNENLLTNCFSEKELKLIQQFWDCFQEYINSYWISKNGQLKTVFSGDVEKKTGEVGKMLIASEILVGKLDTLIRTFQDE